MRNTELAFLSAAELGRLIRDRKISPVEATRCYLDRIDALDFKFNAFITVCRKGALEEARRAEQEISEGLYKGSMHGVPVAVKDQLWTKGIRTTGASPTLADWHPDSDSTVVTKLKESGAIILGKTNMTELALSGSSHRYSVPRNPWNLDMYTGGSSSGSAASAAAFLSATTIGEDTYGSIRWPASWCGLAGIRPSWGLVSRFGLLDSIWSMDTAGPIARTVEDAAITLQAIAGHDPRDPYSWKTPVPNYLESLNRGVSGMRLALITDLLQSTQVHHEVRHAVLEASNALEGLGASVEEVSIPLACHATEIADALRVEPGSNRVDSLRENANQFGHDARIVLLTGAIMPSQYYYKVQRLRAMLRDQYLNILKHYDAVLCPTYGIAAQPIEDDRTFNSKQEAGNNPYPLRRMFNLANVPAMSIPCGFDSRNLPIGLQIGSAPGKEQLIFQVAQAYEQATIWHKQRPPQA